MTFSAELDTSFALAPKGNGCDRKFRHCLKARERRPEAPRSMEELSIRYMELFRTSLDLIHTYGTHDNMSISWSRLCAVRRITPSSRPHRSSARTCHQECGTVPCASRRVRNRRAFNHPHPVRQSHTRPAARWLPSHRGSRHAARAENRRSDASTKQIKPLLATAWSTGPVCTTPK